MKKLMGLTALFALLLGLQGCGENYLDPATVTIDNEFCNSLSTDKENMRKKFKTEEDWGKVYVRCFTRTR